MAESKANREFDIVVWGATGFTGKLVVEYLAQNYLAQNKPLKIAIAGRSESKLNEIKRDIAKTIPVAADLPVIVGDSGDPASLDNLTKKTRVVISTVGPFLKYGTPLVHACVKNATDYIDSTGETPWVKGLIDSYHQEAQNKGVLIVPLCGFDSIPADLGTLFVVDHIKSKLNQQPTEVHSYVRAKGGVSGGTLATMLTMMETNKGPDLQNLFLLNPEEKKPTAKPHDQQQYFASYSKDANAWSAPFVMAAANTQVVRRSSSLLNYGPNFSYNESMRCGNFFQAAGLSIGIAAAMVTVSFSCTRNLVKRFLPSPGQGPSREVMANGFFEYAIYAHTEKGEVVRATVRGGEPGYSETAKMLSESALALVLQRNQVPGRAGGVLTPAASMGAVLIERLHNTGIKFEIK